MRNDGYALELTPDDVDIGRFERRAAEGRALAADGRARSGRRGAGRGRRDLARRSPRRLRVRGVRVGADRPVVRGATCGGRGTAGHRAPARLSPPGDRPARGARRRPSPPRGVARAARCSRSIAPGGRPTRCGSSRRAVSILGEELGLEPGPELRRLESAILTHDPDARRHPRPRRQSHVRSPRIALGHPRGADTARRPRRRGARPQGAVRRASLRSPSSAPEEWARPGWRSRSDGPRPNGLSFGGQLVELAPVGDPAGVPRGDRLRARPVGSESARRADR